MKSFLQLITVLSVIYITFGNPVVEPTEEICNEKVNQLNNSADRCQQSVDQPAMVNILNDIMHYNVTEPLIKRYTEQNCESVNEATQCLIATKNSHHDQRCEKFTKYSQSIYSFDIMLMKTLYLCANNNGQHFDDLIPNNGLKCMYGSESYIKCFVNKQIETNLDPNNVASQTCVNVQTHMHCLDNITDCPNDKAPNVMKGVVMSYKEIFQC